MKKLIGLLFFGMVAGTFAADEQTSNETLSRAESRPFYFDRLSAEDPNFFGYAIPYQDDELDDEEHLEFYISIKSPLFTKPDVWPKGFRWVDSVDAGGWIPHRTVFIYNGLYDFYLGSDRYPSSPIISRQQNPGAAFEWDGPKRTQWRLGYFHESNGQSVSTSNEYAEAEAEYGEEYAHSQVSRGWDYANLRFLFDSNPGRSNHTSFWWRYSLEYRRHFDFQGFGSMDKEDEIFWEPVDEQPEIDDYDGLRAMLEYTYDRGNGNILNGIMGRIEAKTGVADMDALENYTGKYTLNLKFWSTWISAFYFDGYGKEPSTYHRKTQYFGVGIELR
jgi:hypothetical protein